MEFQHVISKRRMVRNYTDAPVAGESVERIIDAGLKAPSAGNSQGLGFVVVTDSEHRREIAELADEPAYVSAGFDPWISKAPVHLVISVSEEAYHERYRDADKLGTDGEEIEWPVPFWWVDAGAAMMGVLLAVVDEGLAAGFLGVHAVSDLSESVGLPEDQHPIGIVTVGHPAPDRRSRSLARGKKSRESMVHRERWDS
jgi:nitroreductase